MKKVLWISLIFLSYTVSTAQSFEGIITYTIAYESLPADMQEAMAMMPKEQTFYIKNNMSKFVQETGMTSTIVISNSDDNTSVLLMDAMGQKFKMTINSDEINNEQENAPNIEYVSGTKTIAGYICKKAIIKMEGFDEEAVFYYTEEIPPLKLSGMEGLHLKGLPLEYAISAEGIKMVLKVSRVEKTTIDDSIFDIPEGYTEMPDYMKKAMEQADY